MQKARRTRHLDLGLAALIVVCGAGLANAQTNPCTAPLPTTVVLNPKGLAATLPEQTAIREDGTPVVTEYLIGQFLQGVDPATGGMPVQSTPIRKQDWVLVDGTTDCYRMTSLTFISIPLGQRYVSAIKARRFNVVGGSIEESEWSLVSNPFGRSAAPMTPGRPVVHQ